MKQWNLARLLLSLLTSLLVWFIPASLCFASAPMEGSAGRARNFVRFVLKRCVLHLSSAHHWPPRALSYQAILAIRWLIPYLLGVSSGASLMAYVWGFQFANNLFGVTLVAMGQQAFAFAGALMAVGVVLALATRRGRMHPVTLLLVGVIVNAIAGSLFLLLNAMRPERLAGTGSALAFLVGGIQTNLSSAQILLAAFCASAGWIALFYLTGQLNVAALSEPEAEALGIRIHRLRWLALGVASIVTASGVAVSGPIGFVGLICPHLARLIVGAIIAAAPDRNRLRRRAPSAGRMRVLACSTAPGRHCFP